VKADQRHDILITEVSTVSWCWQAHCLMQVLCWPVRGQTTSSGSWRALRAR